MKIELGDLLVTRNYDKGLVIEICQYRGTTGALMIRVTSGCIHDMERFVKDGASHSYARHIPAKDAAQFLKDNKDK